MGFSTRAPARIFSLRSFSLSVAFRLLLIFPTLETAYLVPDDLLIRQRGVPESSDEEVPAIPYSSDGDGGWSGTAGKSDMDEGAVLTEVAYRLMTRRLSYTPPKIPKIKRNPSIMALDNIDFAITALDSNRNHQRRTKGAIDQLMSSTGAQTGGHQHSHHDAASPHRVHWSRAPSGFASLLPSSGSSLPPSSPRRDRLVLNVSATDIRNLINMIEKGKRGSRKSKMTSSSVD